MAKTERRLRVLCAAATGVALPIDEAPGRDVLLLFQLRNWMVHLRPEKLTLRPGRADEPSSMVSLEVHDLVKELRKVGAITAIPSGHIVPVMRAMQLDGVSRWAYGAAYSALDAICGWVPEWRGRILLIHRPPSSIDDDDVLPGMSSETRYAAELVNEGPPRGARRQDQVRRPLYPLPVGRDGLGDRTLPIPA